MGIQLSGRRHENPMHWGGVNYLKREGLNSLQISEGSLQKRKGAVIDGGWGAFLSTSWFISIKYPKQIYLSSTNAVILLIIVIIFWCGLLTQKISH